MSPMKKKLWTLRIDPEFRDLIRPLFQYEYLQLEQNLLTDGCREPICVWGDIIIDGHNRYSICKKHSIPFTIQRMSFTCREEVVSWICSNQLGRRNLTEESRKFLIGRQYEVEKIMVRKQKKEKEAEREISNAEHRYNSSASSNDRTRMTKKKTAARIADENHISHGTVEKYALYSRAIDEINKKDPDMASNILSGRYKISHNGVMELSHKSAQEISELNKKLENAPHPFATYQTTRQEIRSKQMLERQAMNQAGPSVKDIPAFDPDAEVMSLSLTVPSWTGSIERIKHTNIEEITDAARAKLKHALLDLQNTVADMLQLIGEKHYE